MAETCPVCALPVLDTQAGLLEPVACRFGLFAADGRRVTEGEIRALVRAGRPVGHKRHRCTPPEPPRQSAGPAQGELFPIPGGTDNTGSEPR